MKITKKEFDYVLGLLEHDEIIDHYQFLAKKNAIRVCSDVYEETYYFNEEDILINPELREVQEEIENLQKKINELQKIEENLLTIK